MFHPSRKDAADLWWIGLPNEPRVVARRMKASRPDAVVVSAHAVVEKLRAQDPAAVSELPIINLHWLPTAPEIGGVDQSYDMVAANAVDLVVSQVPLAATWGMRYFRYRDAEPKLSSVNPYRLISVRDHVGAHAQVDNPAVAAAQLRTATIVAVHRPDAPELPFARNRPP